ncbi:MAG TPA: low affinity iron permease family protein [Verrucomicrobiae bacterium]|nr:low affinity iron permease family protein [Verrucomicrobiae bacterium]
MFRKIATRISIATGHAAAFTLAFLLVIGWAVTGPFFEFSNTWQLFINTGTTITTFLMVFLIQNTQNRDGKAMQLKLDELLLSTRGRDAFVDLEDMTDEELDELDREFREIHSKQSTSRTMKKLHSKIAEAHATRKGN